MENSELNAKKEIAAEVEQKFGELSRERKKLEREWKLNMDFVNGNQYRSILPSGEIAQSEREYVWEQRRVFNHIAPIVDTRLSKLSRIRPALAARAASDEESDLRAAEISSAILTAVQDGYDFDGIISAATTWSEICGTAFYKVIWDFDGGKKVGESGDGKSINEGGVRIIPVSPFEIYPYSLAEESIEGQTGLIHAKLLPVSLIKDMYGAELAGRELGEFGTAQADGADAAVAAQTHKGAGNYELVLERYEKPRADMPLGRLTVVAGGALLYDGDLPYANGENGGRTYPFIKQTAMPSAGNFFGESVVKRLIPVQRAFNAVKNRKHEYLNRISMGTVAVEDGSVDVDELADEGLAPGKVIIYRQGGNPPELLGTGGVPDEFWKEEESLLNEFTKISGTGDLSENADKFAGVTSATGLQLIIEQDDARLNVAYQSLKRAVKNVGRHVLRLFKQFASETRLLRYAGADGIKVCFFKGSDISCDDVVLEADTDLNLSPAQKRTLIFELMDRGLFTDSDGRMTVKAKRKILSLLGYASLADLVPCEEITENGKGEING